MSLACPPHAWLASVTYLTTKIVESRQQPCANPNSGMARDGYTLRRGAPTSIMVRLDGETRWRRLYAWQFSNAGTCFVRIKGEPLVVSEYDIPKPF